jgi:hypothetical protein
MDTLYGDIGDNLLDGGSENDELYGGDGNDGLFGRKRLRPASAARHSSDFVTLV